MHETREISQLGMFGLNMCPETLWREIIQGGRVVIIWDTLFRTFITLSRQSKTCPILTRPQIRIDLDPHICSESMT